MNASAHPIAVAEALTDISVIERDSAFRIFTDPEAFDAYFKRVEAETRVEAPDVSTQAGRDEIRSAAFNVAKSKAGLEKARLGLTQEWRENTTKANDAGKVMTARLEALQVEIRAPLTAYEEEEKARKAAIEGVLARMHDAAVISIEDTPETVAARLDEARGAEITDEVFGDYAEAARSRRTETIATLEAAHARLVKAAADAAELAELRAANEAREAAEAAERQRQAVETQRLADEAEAARLRQVAIDEAANTARAEEQRKADEAAAERERRHNEELAAARAETQRLADEKAEAERVAQKERDADAARQADAAHRAQVQATAAEAMATHGGVAKATAMKIVLAIAAGEVPGVTLAY